MAWKKRKKKYLDGEIVEPSPWRINQNEYASEFNGFLDNDNMKNHSISAKHIKRDTFTRVLANHRFSYYAYIFSHEQGGWSNVADFLGREAYETRWHGIGSTPHREQITIESYGLTEIPGSGVSSVPSLKTDDGLLATVHSLHSSPDIDIGYGESRTVDYPLLAHRSQSPDEGFNGEQYAPYGRDNTTRMPFYEFEAEVDCLLIVDFNATVSWLPYIGSLTSSSKFFKNSWGRHHDLEVAWPPSGKYEYTTSSLPYHYADIHYSHGEGRHNRNTDVWILCSQLRITIDGNVISKTGFMGPELCHHPVYLNGAEPISAGKHTLQVEARFRWVNPVSGASRPSSTSDYRFEVGSDKGNLRHPCSIRFPNLIAQLRSR